MQKFKEYCKAALTSWIFWTIVGLILVIVGINYLEQFTQVGVNNQYQIF